MTKHTEHVEKHVEKHVETPKAATSSRDIEPTRRSDPVTVQVAPLPAPTMGRIVMYRHPDGVVNPAIVVAINSASLGLFVFHAGGGTNWIDATQASETDPSGWFWPTRTA